MQRPPPRPSPVHQAPRSRPPQRRRIGTLAPTTVVQVQDAHGQQRSECQQRLQLWAGSRMPPAAELGVRLLAHVPLSQRHHRSSRTARTRQSGAGRVGLHGIGTRVPDLRRRRAERSQARDGAWPRRVWCTSEPTMWWLPWRERRLVCERWQVSADGVARSPLAPEGTGPQSPGRRAAPAGVALLRLTSRGPRRLPLCGRAPVHRPPGDGVVFLNWPEGSKPNHTMIGTIVFCTLTQEAPAV